MKLAMTRDEAKEEAGRKSIPELREVLGVLPSETPELIAKRFALTIIQQPDGAIIVHPIADPSLQVVGSIDRPGEASPILRTVLTCAFVTELGTFS